MTRRKIMWACAPGLIILAALWILGLSIEVGRWDQEVGVMVIIAMTVWIVIGPWIIKGT